MSGGELETLLYDHLQKAASKEDVDIWNNIDYYGKEAYLVKLCERVKNKKLVYGFDTKNNKYDLLYIFNMTHIINLI